MSDCVESHLALNEDGYCRTSIGSVLDGTKRIRHHHRIVYARHHGFDVDGPEMRGLEIDHLCRNRRCINVDHLELVTRHQNFWRSSVPQLSEGNVRDIRDHYRLHGLSQETLAALHGVTQVSISQVIHRKTWKHVA